MGQHPWASETGAPVRHAAAAAVGRPLWSRGGRTTASVAVHGPSMWRGTASAGRRGALLPRVAGRRTLCRRTRAAAAHPLPLACVTLQYWNGLWFHDNDIVRTVMTIFFFIGEPIRLAAGFYGNLHENVRARACHVGVPGTGLLRSRVEGGHRGGGRRRCCWRLAWHVPASLT